MASSSPAPPRSKLAATSKSTAVESILQTATGGVVVNDPNGLCLVNKGNLLPGNDTGVVTSMVRLAQQLEASGGGSNPLITIEHDDSAVLIKDYENHAVALQVPKKSETAAAEGAGGAAAGTTE